MSVAQVLSRHDTTGNEKVVDGGPRTFGDRCTGLARAPAPSTYLPSLASRGRGRQ